MHAAAIRGHAAAQFNLGVIFYHGIGVGKIDKFLALKCFLAAELRGHKGGTKWAAKLSMASCASLGNRDLGTPDGAAEVDPVKVL